MVPLLVPGCRRMLTSVGEHGMVPLLVPGVFSPAGFSMQAHVFSETRHHYFSGVHCGTCSLALKARAEAVLTTILYIPFDVVYCLFLCVMLLLCQLELLSVEWYSSLFLKFFHQLIFSCRHMYVFFRDTWHHLYNSTCFCGKHFYFPCFFTFYGV